MSYTSFLTPRREILSEEGPDPIIDLANLEDTKRKKLEANPDAFFSLTFPTADIRRVVGNINDRFTGKSGVPGLFLFEGLKGSGKSHLLVTIFHLFHSPAQSKAWLNQHSINCSLPDDVTVIHNKFTDQPLDSIWDFIFFKLTGRRPAKKIVQPGLEDIQKILPGSKRLVLILDELEQGIRSISDPAVQAQNIAFLQMLSEWGARSNQVTIFASIYSDVQEPGNTLKRVPSVRVQFSHASEKDRANVVLHRLFENYLSFEPKSVTSVVEGYVNYWARYHHFSADEYRERLYQTFPFTPDLLDVILKRVPARGGFQNVRGALGFLSNMVRLTYTSTDLITAGHASLTDREIQVRLSDLDTSGDLVNRAGDNLRDLNSIPLANEIASATLLYTLSGAGRNAGATKDELIRATLRPGIDINDFEQSISAFQRYASNFHESDGRFFFDLEENADAKVEFHSLRKEYEERAPIELHNVWRNDVFGEPSAIVYGNDEIFTRESIEKLEKGRLRWVLSPRRLTPQERHSLYFGLSWRNEVILLEPKDDAINLETNPDFLKWMRRSLAATDLAARTTDINRRDEYLRISREERNFIIQAIRRAGLTYVKWISYASQALSDDVEEESLGTASKKEDVLTSLAQNHYPLTFFVDHLSDHLDEIKGHTVKDIENQYRNNLGYPVPTHAGRVSGAIRQLCKDRKLSLNHQRGNFCGNDIVLSDAELANATIDAPFAEATSSKIRSVAEPDRVFGVDSGLVEPMVADNEVEIPDLFPVTSPIDLTDISTLPQVSIGALRQAIAERLQMYPESRVRQVQFSIVIERSAGDLSTLPSAIRGSLSGSGDVYAEINIKRRGDFTKAEIEEMAERLPVISGAEYRVDLKVKIGEGNDQQ